MNHSLSDLPHQAIEDAHGLLERIHLGVLACSGFHVRIDPSVDFVCVRMWALGILDKKVFYLWTFRSLGPPKS